MLLLNVIVIVSTDLYLSKNFRAWLQRSSVMVVRSETKKKHEDRFSDFMERALVMFGAGWGVGASDND